MCVRNIYINQKLYQNYDQFYYYQQFTIESLYKFMYSIVYLY